MAQKPLNTYSNNPNPQKLIEGESQAFTATFADLGAEGISKGADRAVLFLELDVGGSVNMTVRVLAKLRKEFDNAIAMANEAKAKLNAHYADATEHTAGQQTAISTDDASDIGSLIALVTALLASYELHDADAELGAAWDYHIAQEAGDNSLASTVAPTDLSECLTKLADIKAKVSSHFEDSTSHTTGDSQPVLEGDLEFSPSILTESASKVSVEDEVFEFNVDADQNSVIDIPLNRAIPIIQLQIKDGAAGGGVVRNAYIIYRKNL